MAAWQPSRPRPSFLTRQRAHAARWLAVAVWLAAIVALLLLRGVAPAHDLPAIADVERHDVVARAGGTIAAVLVQRHEFVAAGTIVARVDDTGVRAALARVRGELAQLTATADAADAAWRALLGSRCDLEGARLDALAAAAAAPEPAATSAAAPALARRIDELDATCTLHRRELAAAAAVELPAARRAQLDALDAHLDQLADDVQALALRAPCAGHIGAITRGAGAWAAAGDVVLTIVGARASRVLAYADAQQLQRITSARRLDVRRAGVVLGATHVVSVGPALVPLPARLWRDAQREEWGCEIVLAPTGLELPGEQVTVAARD